MHGRASWTKTTASCCITRADEVHRVAVIRLRDSAGNRLDRPPGAQVLSKFCWSGPALHVDNCAYALGSSGLYFVADRGVRDMSAIRFDDCSRFQIVEAIDRWDILFGRRS